MKETTKKWLAVAVLILLCAGLVLGICKVLYRKNRRDAVVTGKEPDETQVVVDLESEPESEKVTDWEESTEETSTEPQEEDPREPEPETGLVIETKVHDAPDGTDQEVQKEPVKTEKEKPKAPPTLPEGTDTKDPETPPVYEETAEERPEEPPVVQPQDTEPKTGESKDGMVYVEGFGWIRDEGAGTGIPADDMYENGNKIGIMD